LARHVTEYTDTGKILFWLENSIANTGKGPLHLKGGDTLSVDPDTVAAVQRITIEFPDIDGPSVDWFDTVGVFVYDTTEGHDHWHFSGFAEYRILEFVDDTTVGSEVRSSPKVGFCLLDHLAHNSSACGCCSTIEGQEAPYAIYEGENCENLEPMGISVGWYDLYNINLEGQFIDVTEVDNGVYWLQSIVDPDDYLNQTNQADDTAMIRVQVITEIDRFEENDSSESVDAMPLGGLNSSKIVPCSFPVTIDGLSIHQSYAFDAYDITPDEDWFKFLITEIAGSSHYVRIDFDYDLGDLELQILDSAGGG
jgi:hypothetical protein